MRLLLMRHGATASNEARRYLGRRTDEPLSEAGRAQCARAGADDRVRRVYVSPLRRARETAGLCFPRACQVVVDGLEEFDFGAFEGRSAAEMKDDPSYRSWVDGLCMGRCPGGDSRDSFVRRSNGALEALVREAAAGGEQRLVVVAHGGTIMAALSAFAQADRQDDGYFEWHVGACEGYVARVRLEDDDLLLHQPTHVDRLPVW